MKWQFGTIRLARNHFAHLLAVCEGIDWKVSAERYLGSSDLQEAKAAHQQTVDAVRAIVRRSNDNAWRLIGVNIRVESKSKLPTLEEFVEERGLDGWSEDEVLEMYQDAFEGPDKRTKRRTKLRDRQIALIRRIEGIASEDPAPGDHISGWFDSKTAERLLPLEVETLQDLYDLIVSKKNWFSLIDGIGKEKADRIESHLRLLLPNITFTKKSFPLIDGGPVIAQVAALSSSRVFYKNDSEAISAWIENCAKSPATRKSYLRESNRLLLWLKRQSFEVTFREVRNTHCQGYKEFLSSIPSDWISVTHASPGQEGWAPFRGQINSSSINHAIDTITALFSWLQSEHYIEKNPWKSIAQSLKKDEEVKKEIGNSKSFKGVDAVIKYLQAEKDSVSKIRMLFLLKFTHELKIHPNALLDKTVASIYKLDEKFAISIKDRSIVLTDYSIDLLNQYFANRGLPSIGQCTNNTPLLPSTLDQSKGIGYQSLYEQIKIWFKKANVPTSALSSHA
jgi:site-specific recombinase XerD